jgi:glutamine amidotransferase
MSGYKKKIKVGIINLNTNNMFSIYNAFKKEFNNTQILEKNDKKKYDLLVLPGVGAYEAGMKKLSDKGFNDKIYEHIQNKNKLIYGVCLGMQLMLDYSFEFGKTKGLGIINGHVERLVGNNKSYKVPNIGWHKIYSNNYNFISKDYLKKYFFFIHSYHCVLKNKKYLDTYINYNKKKICSSFMHQNIFATQFHPEKSGINGLKLIKSLSNFF